MIGNGDRNMLAGLKQRNIYDLRPASFSSTSELIVNIFAANNMHK